MIFGVRGPVAGAPGPRERPRLLLSGTHDDQPEGIAMSDAIRAVARSVSVFGVYMLVQGTVLLFTPNLLLSIAGLPPSEGPWVRFVGWCLIALGFYYTQAARAGLTPFFEWTVAVRITYFIVTLGLCLANIAPWILLGFAGVETGFGLWTWLLLRRARAT